MNNIQKTMINPNFSVVTEYMPNLKSAAIGVFFYHGSRYEKESEQGITHLIEHMLFRGTKQKSSKDIFKFVESKGAVIDGFTTKEISGIYCRYFADNFDDMIDLIGEIISAPSFDKQELEKEKNIALQEIADVKEDPQDYVFILLHRALFRNHALSYPTTGTTGSIQSISQNDLKNYYFKNYLPSKVCIAAAGNIDHNKLVNKLQINKHQKLASNPPSPIPPNKDIERITLIQTRNDLTQLHAAAAGFTCSFRDEQRYGMILLNNIWGGTTSSRLFHRVREQEGLVYTIFSFIDMYSDIGILGAYFVSDVKNQEAIFRAGYEETIKLQKDGITQEELERTVNYCKGLIILGSEDPMSRMIRNAKNDLILGKVIPIEESISKFEQYKVNDINDLTNQLPTNYCVANIGPIDQLDYLKKSGGPQSVIISD